MATTDENTLRDELESSFEIAEEVSSPEVAVESAAPAPEQNYEAPVGETAEQKAQREYIRDETGKFAPKDSQNAAVLEAKTPQNEQKPLQEGVKAGPKAGQPPSQEDRAAKDPIAQAPMSWKPEARELWSQIPEAAKHEIARWEASVKNGLQQASDARRFTEAINDVVGPYRATIEAEGGNVLSAIGDLLKTAQALRTAPPAHKARLVASIVKDYGINIGQLDEALSGAVPPPESPEVTAMRQQMERELAPVRQWQQQQAMQAQMAQQQMASETQRELQAFSQNAEFINDVRYLMADIIDVREKNGVPYSLDEVYKAACYAHPEVSRVMSQRAQQQQAQTMNNTARKARQAAVSVGGSPALGGSEESSSDSIRDSIMFAMNQSVR